MEKMYYESGKIIKGKIVEIYKDREIGGYNLEVWERGEYGYLHVSDNRNSLEKYSINGKPRYNIGDEIKSKIYIADYEYPSWRTICEGEEIVYGMVEKLAEAICRGKVYEEYKSNVYFFDERDKTFEEIIEIEDYKINITQASEEFLGEYTASNPVAIEIKKDGMVLDVWFERGFVCLYECDSIAVKMKYDSKLYYRNALTEETVMKAKKMVEDCLRIGGLKV